MSHWKSAWVRRRTRRNSTLEDRPRSSVGGSLNSRISLGTPSLFRLCQTRRDSGESGSVGLHGPWVCGSAPGYRRSSSIAGNRVSGCWLVYGSVGRSGYGFCYGIVGFELTSRWSKLRVFVGSWVNELAGKTSLQAVGFWVARVVRVSLSASIFVCLK
jgi:hypothetical protein